MDRIVLFLGGWFALSGAVCVPIAKLLKHLSHSEGPRVSEGVPPTTRIPQPVRHSARVATS